jgi:hypothetical protein
MELDTKTYWLPDWPLVVMWLWLMLLESPGGFSSWEYKDENGAWIVKINWAQIKTEEYRVIEGEIAKRPQSDLKC